MFIISWLKNKHRRSSYTELSVIMIFQFEKTKYFEMTCVQVGSRYKNLLANILTIYYLKIERLRLSRTT